MPKEKSQPANHQASKKSLRPLRRAELPQDTEALARYLIGKTLVRETPRGRIIGRIVETEAYVLGDSAGHGFRGETPRNRSLFLQRGHAYVYFIYGMHYALNVSAGAKGQGTGVLIRALEPVEGIEQMQKNRGIKNVHELTKGPGRLAEALQIDKRLDGTDLCVAPAASRRSSVNKSRLSHPLWLAEALAPPAPIATSKRIGITKEIHRPLRFYEQGNTYVSGPKRLNQ
ncbi:MAG: DNA-3-methyladenine glycosylase [Candidatus Acidiferrales bacterium]